MLLKYPGLQSHPGLQYGVRQYSGAEHVLHKLTQFTYSSFTGHCTESTEGQIIILSQSIYFQKIFEEIVAKLC